MPAIDDGRKIKIYGSDGDIAGQKEVIIGTKRLDAQMTSTDRVVSFCTDASGANPVEKAYVDAFGQVVGTAGSSLVSLGNDGTLSVNTTAVGNVGASGPDDLITYSMPANVLNVTGRGVRVKAWGTTANNANSKTVRLVFGGTTLVTKQLTVSVAGTWELEAVVYRTGLSAQVWYAKALNNNGSVVASADGATVVLQAAQGTATETETSPIVIKGQSTVSTADNDIVQNGLVVEFM